jgi:hypothetical protein
MSAEISSHGGKLVSAQTTRLSNERNPFPIDKIPPSDIDMDAPPPMEPNSTPVTVAAVAGLQMSAEISSHGGKLVSAQTASLSNEQNPFPVDTIRPSDVVMDDANKIDSAAPCATPLDDLDPLTHVNMNPKPMSALSVAPASLVIPVLPMNPTTQGFAVDSDGAAVASRKGTIMRPNPQSTTAR